MEINRNQYFAIGVVVLFLGIQFRYFESFTLNSEASAFVRDKLSNKKKTAMVTTPYYEDNTNNFFGYQSFSGSGSTYSGGYSGAEYSNSEYNNYYDSSPVLASTMTVKPPKWIGWALVSAGGILILHSLAMKKPE